MGARASRSALAEASHPPRTVHDERGEVVGVILSYEDYQTFLHLLAEHADWETLPVHLRDAVDHFLADEAELEGGPARPLRELLRETGELP